MNGKILKIANNDLYGNVDDRSITVFAVFNHLKYMNKYVIFTYANEYDKNKLYFGSVHLKNNSLVVFMINDNYKQFIFKFVNDYLNKRVDPNEYEIINITNIQKIELVSFNEMDFNQLPDLDKLSIYHKPVIIEETKEKKPVLAYILLIILFLLLIGISVLYFFPDKFTQKLPLLDCQIDSYSQTLNLNYTTTKTIKFNYRKEIKTIYVTDNYQFKNRNVYNEFKNNSNQTSLIPSKGTYTYDDNSLRLKIEYEENSIITDYDEIKEYLTLNGYTCKEDVYNE